MNAARTKAQWEQAREAQGEKDKLLFSMQANTPEEVIEILRTAILTDTRWQDKELKNLIRAVHDAGWDRIE